MNFSSQSNPQKQIENQVKPSLKYTDQNDRLEDTVYKFMCIK